MMLAGKNMKYVRVHWTVIGKRVKESGGRIEIPAHVIRELITLNYFSEVKNKNTLILFLRPRTEGLLNPAEFPNMMLYRMEIIMRYLIYTSPSKRLVITNEDLQQQHSVITFPENGALVVKLHDGSEVGDTVSLTGGDYIISYPGQKEVVPAGGKSP